MRYFVTAFKGCHDNRLTSPAAQTRRLQLVLKRVICQIKYFCLRQVGMCVAVSRVRSISPVQCKGVVELDMRVSHGVKGRELLQSLNQLHDGLVVLKEQSNERPAAAALLA